MKQKIVQYLIKNYIKLIKLLIAIGIVIVLTQCVKFGYDEKTGWYFHWMPAANINIGVKK